MTKSAAHKLYCPLCRNRPPFKPTTAHEAEATTKSPCRDCGETLTHAGYHVRDALCKRCARGGKCRGCGGKR